MPAEKKSLYAYQKQCVAIMTLANCLAKSKGKSLIA